MRGWIFGAFAGLLLAGCTVMLPVMQMAVQNGHPDFVNYPHLHDLDSLRVDQIVAVTDRAYHRHVGRYEGMGVYDWEEYSERYAQALEASPGSPWPRLESPIQIKTLSDSTLHSRFLGFDFEAICLADSVSYEVSRIPLNQITGLLISPGQKLNLAALKTDLAYRRLPAWSFLSLKAKGKPVRISFYEIKNIEVPQPPKYPWSMTLVGLMVDVLICLMALPAALKSAYASMGS